MKKEIQSEEELHFNNIFPMFFYIKIFMQGSRGLNKDKKKKMVN